MISRRRLRRRERRVRGRTVCAVLGHLPTHNPDMTTGWHDVLTLLDGGRTITYVDGKRAGACPRCGAVRP